MTTTIHDVARRARVSVTTVSRALTQPELLRPSTRLRVLKVAKALAYHPNRAARSLITGKTGTIGIIVPDLANPFYPGVLRGVQTRAHESGYAVLLADSDEDPAAEENLVHTMAKQVDGVIVCAPFAADARLRRLATSTNLVLINRRCGAIPAALMDIARGMRDVVDHLRAIGHRGVAYLGGPARAWSNRERLRGLRAACDANRVRLIEFGAFEPKFESGIEGADLAIDAGATAIVAYNDLMALGVLSRLAARGVRVPYDVSVVGIDDLLFASMCAPPLTTVAMPMEATGRAAADLLLRQCAEKRIDDRASTNFRLATRLMVRSTTAPPRLAPRSGPSHQRKAAPARK
ncbi:MAG TPA: LacI family DNA-binding transcriptional regulator [Casimicrobiaceae bacterium]|jgi:DNA-binding LacI/PurR family transcriptional regulator